MKTLLNMFSIFAIVLSLNTCKENTKTTDQIQSKERTLTNKTEKVTNNYTAPSDKFFAKAIKDFDDNYMEGAESILDLAILAIEYEGEGLEGIQKNAFNNAINDLKAVNKNIKKGKHVTKHQLLQAIENARYPLYHPTFQEDTVIIIAKPEEQNEIKINRAFNESTALFKVENKKFDNAIKQEMKVLKKEGEQIEKLKKELQSKMKTHLKKTQEFNKNNNPEYYDESFVLGTDNKTL